MRTAFVTVALCAAAAVAAPTASVQGEPTGVVGELTSNLPELPIEERHEDSAVLEDALSHVEEILSSDGSAESKVQDILNTIVNDISARDVEEDPLDEVLEKVEGILSGDLSVEEKLREILDELMSVTDELDLPVKRSDDSDLPGLDLDTLADLPISDLLEAIECLLAQLEKEVISILRHVDPALAKTVRKLLKEVDHITSEVESELGLNKRSLLGLDLDELDIPGLDLDVIDTLDAHDLIHEINCLVDMVERFLVKELRGLDADLAHTVRKLLNEVNNVVHKVEADLGY